MASSLQRGRKFLRPINWYKSLLNLKDRITEGYFLVDGPRAVKQILSSFPQYIDEILVDDEQNHETRFQCPVRVLTRRQIESISGTVTPQGIIAVVHLPVEVYTSSLPQIIGERILLLEHIQDPGNVGTLIRTASAFNYSGVILSTWCADPFSSKVVQASAGSILSVWLRRTSEYLDILSKLKCLGYSVAAAELSGSDKMNFTTLSKHVLGLGNEGAGLTSELLNLADIRFSIPMNNNNVESLNVAASGAIAMFCGARGMYLK